MLEELGDDAIIAQQAAVHLPQPRAQVAIESRSIVITDERSGPDSSRAEGEPTRELLPYAVSSVDPTVVIRDRKFIQSLGSPNATNGAKSSNLIKIVLWGGAGLIAFAVGGALALLTANRPLSGGADGAPAAVPSQEAPTTQVAPPASAVNLDMPAAPSETQPAATPETAADGALAPKTTAVKDR